MSLAVPAVFQLYDLHHFLSGRDSPLQTPDLVRIVYVGIPPLAKIVGVGDSLGIPVIIFS